MDVTALAKEKVGLEAVLTAISMWNTAGQSVDDLISVEVRRVETLKRLAEISAELNKYINGGA